MDLGASYIRGIWSLRKESALWEGASTPNGRVQGRAAWEAQRPGFDFWINEITFKKL